MKTIACFGSGSGAQGDAQYDAMVEVGRLLAERGCTVITGGFGGAGMEAPAKGAMNAHGKTVGYTFLRKPGNPYLEKTIDCQLRFMGSDFLSPEQQYGLRLGSLLEAEGFIIAAQGGPGTMVELMAIINLNTKLWREKPKRFAVLDSSFGESWDMKMFDKLFQWGVCPREVAFLLHISTSPEQVVDWVCT